MEYANVKPAKFLSRLNRFIADIEVEGEREIAHVKNTGRCRELLIPGADVFVQESDNPDRKTKYDLISVFKGESLINIDSQAPNKVFSEWARKGGLFDDIRIIKAEVKYGSSRFDFYIETKEQRAFVEVKGVTLEQDGVAMFPDAPTERGIKHINELCASINEGYKAYLVFIIQMKDVLFFTPNNNTHRAFGEALKSAAAHGVKVLAVDCDVTERSITARNYVSIKLP